LELPCRRGEVGGVSGRAGVRERAVSPLVRRVQLAADAPGSPTDELDRVGLFVVDDGRAVPSVGPPFRPNRDTKRRVDLEVFTCAGSNPVRFLSQLRQPAD
jgi:hypothetical protein